MRLLIFFFTVLCIIVSCTKQSPTDKIPVVLESKKLQNVQFASFSKPVPPGGGGEYDEQACTVLVGEKWEAGTKCFASVGKSCSKATDCVAITDIASSGQYTKDEVDAKIMLIEKAYGIKYTY